MPRSTTHSSAALTVAGCVRTSRHGVDAHPSTSERFARGVNQSAHAASPSTDDADAWSFRPPEVPRATVAVAAAIADRSSNSSSPSAAAALRASAAAIAGRRAATNAAACSAAEPAPSVVRRGGAAALAAPAAPRRCSSCGALPAATRSLPAIDGATYAATLEEPGDSRLRPERRRRQVAEPES